MASLKVAFVVLMCMAVVGAPIAQAITCGQVTSSVMPCAGYITSGKGPAPACCNGIKSVMAAARTPSDRRTVCNCLKSAAGKFTGFNPKNAETLPSKCGVNVPYKISTSTNCARYYTEVCNGHLYHLFMYNHFMLTKD